MQQVRKNRAWGMPAAAAAGIWVAAGAWSLGAQAAVFEGEVLQERINTQYQPIRLVQIADGLERPWSVAFLPDGRYLVTERPGRLNLIDGGEVIALDGLPEDISTAGQGGLMEVSLHPDYENNGWVYLTYARGDDEGAATALARARLEGESLVDLEGLFEEGQRTQPFGHYGSRIVWLRDGTMLMSIGDRFTEPARAQDTMDHAGSILRLTEDGTAPDNNPFLGQEGYLPEIYSYGHRNPQGLLVHPQTGVVWSTEHGPRGGDELNLIEAGRNYGWPVVSRGRQYPTEAAFGFRGHPDMAEPVYEFLPTLAPSGLALVTSEHFPNWQGNLLAGGLGSQRILRVVLDDTDVLHIEELLLREVGRIRDVRQSPNGFIYVVNDEPEGGLFRIEPAAE